MIVSRHSSTFLVFPLLLAVFVCCSSPTDELNLEETVPLKTETVVRDSLAKGDTKHYTSKISINQEYVVCIMAATALPLEVRIRDGSFTDLIGWRGIDRSPEVVRFTVASDNLYGLSIVSVSAEFVQADSVGYSILVTPTPPFCPMKRDGSTTNPRYIAPGVITLGCVPTRSTSYYYSDELESGHPHLISICRLQNSGTLNVYGSPGFHGLQLPCTDFQSVMECTSVTVSPVYFSVDSSPVDRVGAYYLIYVE